MALNPETASFVGLVNQHLRSSRDSTADEFLKGIRSMQLTEFAQLVATFEESNPYTPEAPTLPELPEAPEQWSTADIHAAVTYFYGESYSISETHAALVVSQLVVDYNLSGIPIEWSVVQATLQAMSSAGTITISSSS